MRHLGGTCRSLVNVGNGGLVANHSWPYAVSTGVTRSSNSFTLKDEPHQERPNDLDHIAQVSGMASLAICNLVRLRSYAGFPMRFPVSTHGKTFVIAVKLTAPLGIHLRMADRTRYAPLRLGIPRRH